MTGSATLQLPQPDPSTYVPPATPAAEQRLVRPTNGRRLGGVCAGIADRYGWSRTTVRLIALLSIFLPGPQVIAYIVGWLVIPAESDFEAIIDVDDVAKKVKKDVRNVVKA